MSKKRTFLKILSAAVLAPERQISPSPLASTDAKAMFRPSQNRSAAC